MCYKNIEKGFQYAFSSALRAYRRGSTAIGCAIMNNQNECVSTGENSIYANDDTEKINRHNLAHAEINAILKAGSGRNADVSNYTIYTTMEPCIMCFGAIVMCYYNKVKFAAVDPYGGATKLNMQNGYGLQIEGSFDELQNIQVALSVYRGLKLNMSFVHRTLSMYKGICESGLILGRKLYDDTIFSEMIETSSVSCEEVIDYMFLQRTK